MSTSAPSTASRSNVAELLASGRHSYSFEFFPPKTDEGERALWQSLRELEPLQPTFVSVTYGAGGSERHRTVGITERIEGETTMMPVAHLTCVGSPVSELRQVIGQYASAGVRNVLALRGDAPGGPGVAWQAHAEGFRHAHELVGLVRELGEFCVGVAAFPQGHPEAPDLDTDARMLALKAEAGAQYAITQFFFEPDDYFRLVDRAQRYGSDIPIVPGIMPITNVSQIRRFADLAGAPLPDALVTRLLAVEDDPEAVRALGVEVATDLCARLLDGGAPGLHFYTLNRSTATREVYQALGLAGRGG